MPALALALAAGIGSWCWCWCWHAAPYAVGGLGPDGLVAYNTHTLPRGPSPHTS